MRSRKKLKPRWRVLNVITLATIGGLALEHSLHLTPTGHKIILLLIIAVIYGLIGLWVKSNATALEDLDAEEYRKQSRDPAVYGTSQFPTRTQAHFRETMSFYHHEALAERKKQS
jgi:hypothetical protein